MARTHSHCGTTLLRAHTHTECNVLYTTHNLAPLPRCTQNKLFLWKYTTLKQLLVSSVVHSVKKRKGHLDTFFLFSADLMISVDMLSIPSSSLPIPLIQIHPLCRSLLSTHIDQGWMANTLYSANIVFSCLIDSLLINDRECWDS